MSTETEKPALTLAGADGNAISIIGRALEVARKAGWSEEERQAFQDECLSGDYDHLLRTCMKHFRVT